MTALVFVISFLKIDTTKVLITCQCSDKYFKVPLFWPTNDCFKTIEIEKSVTTVFLYNPGQTTKGPKTHKIAYTGFHV